MLSTMKRVWQVVACWLFLLVGAQAANVAWAALNIQKSVFSAESGLLDQEREQYANQLANYATQLLVKETPTPVLMLEVRKVLALALQLSPRNKQAMVLNFQLAKDILPPKEAAVNAIEKEALAKLLFVRAEELKKQGGEENLKLSRYFTQLSAEMDPKNVDYVYASELNRLDHGPVDWEDLMHP